MLFLGPAVELGGIPVLTQHVVPNMSQNRISTVLCPEAALWQPQLSGEGGADEQEVLANGYRWHQVFRELPSQSSRVWHGFSPWQEFYLINSL